jgi:hypothetical protein
LHDVIVAIAQVDLGGRRDEITFFSCQGTERFPERPDCAPQDEHIALVFAQAYNGFLARVGEDLALQLFEAFTIDIDDRKVGVDDGIDDGVR